MISSDCMTAFGGRTIVTAFLLVVLCAGSGNAPAETKEKIRLGAVENVMLLPWAVTLPARIDTGASTSSLDARNLKVKGEMVEFTLPKQHGGQQIRLPIVRWMTVRSAEAKEKRPVVVLDLCIGSVRMQAEVNLNDRSNVKYPMLIGRNVLMRDFVVACDTAFCTTPSCPEVTPK